MIRPKSDDGVPGFFSYSDTCKLVEDRLAVASDFTHLGGLHQIAVLEFDGIEMICKIKIVYASVETNEVTIAIVGVLDDSDREYRRLSADHLAIAIEAS